MQRSESLVATAQKGVVWRRTIRDRGSLIRKRASVLYWPVGQDSIEVQSSRDLDNVLASIETVEVLTTKS